jgi:lipopolysaccharide export system permease protein
MATLIAPLLCFSRLSGDREITALKSAGIGLYQLLPPVLLFSIVMLLATLLVTVRGAPWGSFAFRQLAFEMAKQHFSVAFKEGVLKEIFPDFIVYAHRVHAHEGILEGVFIHDKVSTDVPLEITAQRGVLVRSGAKNEFFSLKLENGTIHQCSLDEGKVRRIHFQAYEINLDRTLSEVSEKLQRTRKKDMDTRVLLERIDQLRAKNRPFEEYMVEFHSRLTVPMSCLVFGLLALPLALQAGPQGSTGKTLAEEGMPPSIGLWGPNLLFGFFAVHLLIRTAKEKPSLVLVKINLLLDSLLKAAGRLLGKKA